MYYINGSKYNMKTINDYFNFLYKLERTYMKYDLSNITKLCNALGNPQNKFKSIHIAGTNGKGATASYTSSALIEHGFRTGLFTSPHILNFNERIRVNGKCISNSYIRTFLDDNIKLIKKIKPSFFEVNTALAFKYFSDKKVDIAVIECGLGGRLDSTNIINPAVSIITQIDMDHMQFLGNTLISIAKEKLGIVKPGVKVIVSDNNKTLKALFHKTISKQELFYLDDIARIKLISKDSIRMVFAMKDKLARIIKFASPLLGDYQSRNISSSYFAVKELMQKENLQFSLNNFTNGISNVKRNTGYFGRLEEIKLNRKKYLFDVSHNPDSIKKSLTSLKGTGFKQDVIIFGIMEDKDYKNAFKEVIKHTNNIILTKPDYLRALEPGILYSYANKLNSTLKKNIMIAYSVKNSLNIADKMNYKNIILIGSFFLVSDGLKALGYKKLPY